jgi:hypothetical protein
MAEIREVRAASDPTYKRLVEIATDGDPGSPPTV